MQNLGFENYCETLKLYLHKYREATKVDRYSVQNQKSDEYGYVGMGAPSGSYY